ILLEPRALCQAHSYPFRPALPAPRPFVGATSPKRSPASPGSRLPTAAVFAPRRLTPAPRHGAIPPSPPPRSPDAAHNERGRHPWNACGSCTGATWPAAAGPCSCPLGAAHTEPVAAVTWASMLQVTELRSFGRRADWGLACTIDRCRPHERNG